MRATQKTRKTLLGVCVMTDPSSPPTGPEESAMRLSWMSRIIGSIFLVLPAITSVQVWIADAPGKIWLTALAVTALAIGVIAWIFRRSLVFCCGLIVASVLIVVPTYLYGVDEAQLPIAGVPFNLFVSGLFLFSLALAAWELARLPRLPLWARFIAPALAVFAAVPVLMGLIEEIPFIEVLVGLWTLPYWTQGAWFGAAVLLPVALLVAILRAAIPGWRSESFRAAVAFASITVLLTASLATGFTMTSRDLVNLTAFVPVPGREAVAPIVELAPAMATAQDGDPAESVPAVADTKPVVTESTQAPSAATGNSELLQALTPPPEKAAAIEAELNQVFDVIEDVLPTIPRDTFDVQAVVGKVGIDPDQLLAWVRENTVWLPYEGALRGPKGVLLDRAGNSLDRALLLSAMFEAAGYKTRLKRAELPSDVAEELVAAAASASIQEPSADADYDLLTEMLNRLESADSPHADQFRQSAEKFRRDRQELINNARDRADRQSKRLLSMVDVPDNQEPTLKAKVLNAATDHWWTEARVNSKWLTLDPAASEAFPAPGNEGKGRGSYRADRLPTNVLHTVTVRVVVEQLTGTRLKERVALEHTITPYSEPVVQLLLAHVPEDWPEELTPLALLEQSDPLRTFVATARKQTKWLPLLQVGKDQVVDQGFTAKGELYKPGGGPAGGGQAKAIGGLAGGLSGGGRSGEGILTAEWIEFEVKSPGLPPEENRRAVFDLLGPAARASKAIIDTIPDGAAQERALSLMGSAEILLQGSHVTDEYLTYEGFSGIVAARDVVVRSFSQPIKLLRGEFELNTGTENSITGPTTELALARRTVGETTNHFGRPNITAFWQMPASRRDDDHFTVNGFDIISNSAGLDAGRVRDFEIQVVSGVSDTVLENSLMSGDSTAANTSRLFEITPDSSWRTIRSDNRNELDAANISPDIIARVDSALEDGFFIVLSTDVPPEQVTWWRLNPVSGEILGIGPSGRGQATVDYKINILNVAAKAGNVVHCVVSSVGRLKKSEGKTSGGDQAKAIGFTLGCLATSLTGLTGALTGMQGVSLAATGMGLAMKGVFD
jgi:hypothetical protein